MGLLDKIKETAGHTADSIADSASGVVKSISDPLTQFSDWIGIKEPLDDLPSSLMDALNGPRKPDEYARVNFLGTNQPLPIHYGDKAKRLNRCKVTYREPEWDLQENTAVWPPFGSQTELDYQTQDGGELLEKEIKLNGCRNRYNAIDFAEAQ